MFIKRLFLIWAMVFWHAYLSFASFADVSAAGNPFLWGGQQLDDLNGPNADAIRSRYQPILNAYPSLEACTKINLSEPHNKKLSIDDLQAMPNLETAEVCLFYDLGKVAGLDEKINSLTVLGFSEENRIATSSGFSVNMSLSKKNGPKSYDTVINNWLYRGLLLVLRLDASANITFIRLKPISKIQF